MPVIDTEGFEALFRRDIDPWNYARSPFEAHKRRVLLRACGSRGYGRALELACAVGETTRSLAPRALRLLALDASPTALAEAKRRTAGLDGVTLRRARLPEEAPRGPFDLIVISELLYYLRPDAAGLLMRRMRAALAPGGRMVLLHHHVDFDDAAQRPDAAQKEAERHLRRRWPEVFSYRDGRFACAAFLRPRR